MRTKEKTKEKLLMLLDEERGNYVSGEELACKLHMSRSAVWKAIKTLQAEGHHIQAVTRRGYCLTEQSADILTPLGISKYLNPSASNLQIEVYPELLSTNRTAKEKMLAGTADKFVILSEQQTEGRGHKGRNFFSPAKTGLYMSLLIRPNVSIQDATLLTAAAAVAVAETLESISGKATQIKWVNDIFQQGKKVAGILTEAGMSLESGKVEYAILGIGVNVFPPESGFPPEFTQAGSVFSSAEGKSGVRGKIAAEILNRLLPLCDGLQTHALLDAYKRHSMVLGKDIFVLEAGKTRAARALDIDEQCHLYVRYENGEEALLNNGEVSIRMKENAED